MGKIHLTGFQIQRGVKFVKTTDCNLWCEYFFAEDAARIIHTHTVLSEAQRVVEPLQMFSKTVRAIGEWSWKRPTQ